MSQDKYDCQVCRQLWRMLTEPDVFDPIDLGSSREAASANCKNHGPLVRDFIELLDKESTDVGFIKWRSGPAAMLVQSLKRKRRTVWDLLLVVEDLVPSHPGTGRILNPQWADLEIVAKWKNACLATHGTACENPMKIENIRPEFLIDVARKCVVRGCDVEGRYLALSYVWGHHRQRVLEPSVRARISQPGSLCLSEIRSNLSPIIGHAMALTSELEERYLWVDALCIDQNDHAHTKRQLQAMAAIYASAFITITSVDGDSNAGILGLQGTSGPREQHQRVFPFGDEQICVRNNHVFFDSRREGYYNRGWTYQETMFASRQIIFLRDEVHWKCQCSVWHEELTLNAEVETYIDPRPRVIMAGFPDLGALSYAIAGYNERTLSYEEDALPAISGLLSTMSRSFTGGFLFGIPEMFFDQCLSWGPYWGSTNLKRRVSSTRSANDKLTPCDLPSWSWIGWQGLVNINDDAARINPRNYDIQETYPTTVWYCGQSPTTAPSMRRRIRSTWYDQRTGRKDFNQPLPEGWTRHSISTCAFSSDEPPLYPEGCGEYVFRHPAMKDPDTETNDWYYPFPLADIQPSTPPFMPEQWPYLFCKTQSVRLWAFCFKTDPRERNIVPLCNDPGVEIGNLHLHNSESLALFPSEPPGKELELVALCRVMRYIKTFNEETDRYDLPIVSFEQVNVLWIEWENGVALRRASGHVSAKEWQKLAVEDIDLVLG
ncbi:heterokaryon incompatibility protein [Cordyceps javanica]|uniref:Heterokaryon incompatibility protein n=1 Tax=Cordyceps javanica TaxID=43265 RepID=A0A545VEJ1_9HYPO|nr:heterokaryon incompatibility protein [Cordyceps javanica]